MKVNGFTVWRFMGRLAELAARAGEQAASIRRLHERLEGSAATGGDFTVTLTAAQARGALRIVRPLRELADRITPETADET